jgi:hypothetical protein
MTAIEHVKIGGFHGYRSLAFRLRKSPTSTGPTSILIQ